MPIEPFSTSPDPFRMGMQLPDGQLTVEDEKVLRKYSEGRELVVNLGAYKGRSSVLLSYFARRVIAVEGRLIPDQAVERLLESAVNSRKNIDLKIALSWDAADCVNDQTVGMVFVDAGHSYGDVMDDFNAWFPKLVRDGIMIFHDYKYMDGSVSESMNVRGAVDKIIASNPDTVEAVDEAGWCKVIRKVR